MTVDIISILSTFLVALLGILGFKKIDSSKRGIKKLTPFGFLLVFIAATALTSSVFQVQKKHEMASTKAQIANMAHKVVLYNINQYILLPALTLTNEIANGDSGVSTLKFYDDIVYMKQFMEKNLGNKFDLSHIKLNDKPKFVKVGLIHKDMMWWEIFEHDFRLARREINDTLAQYAAYMEPNILLAISELAQGEPIVLYLEEVPALMKEKDKDGKYPIRTAELIQAYLFSPEEANLFDKISKVKKLINQKK